MGSFASFAAYDEFTRAWLIACRRVMKRSATLWVIGSYHNIFRVGSLLQDLGFWILNDVIWRKTNPMPNFRGRRFTNADETLIWAAREPASKAYTFNYEALKAGNDDVQMRSDWTFALCTGEERLKDGTGRKSHPTQKPELLLARVILASSRPGAHTGPVRGDRHDGSGGEAPGTGLHRRGARTLLRRRRREADSSSRAAAGSDRGRLHDRARGAAGAVLGPDRTGMIVPGARLRDAKRKVTALVRADGAIAIGEAVGSIHRIGALAVGSMPATAGHSGMWKRQQGWFASTACVPPSERRALEIAWTVRA